jgi:hypothetical protein
MCDSTIFDHFEILMIFKTTPFFTGKTGNISGTAGWKFMKFEHDVPKDMTFNLS